MSKIVEAKVNEWGDNDPVKVAKSQYFEAYKVGDEIKLYDLNDNYTMLDKSELNELIKMLQKCARELK